MTRATLLRAENLRLILGGEPLLSGVSLQLQQGEKVALLGPNGAGKTTLLNVLAGERAAEGTLWQPTWLRVSALSQTPLTGLDPELTVTAALTAEDPYAALWDRLHTATPEEREAIEARLHAADAGGWRARAAALAGALALPEVPLGALSGGERTRLALALTLASEADLLLLDEPTNHLDLPRRRWLQERLGRVQAAVLLVTHDRALCDGVAERSLWLSGGELRAYRGGFTAAWREREREERARRRQAGQERREAERLRGSGQRAARWGRGGALQARAARLSPVGAGSGIIPAFRPLFRGGEAQPQNGLLLEARLRIAVGDRTLRAHLRLRPGERMALSGANGDGKTTLLRALAAALPGGPPPEDVRGDVWAAAGLRALHLDQQGQGLQAGVPLQQQAAARLGGRAARALARAGLPAALWALPPERLSGGQRARAGLAIAGEEGAGLLLLDEPTNHLDVESMIALERALREYPGALLLVSHDRALLRGVCGRFLGIAWQGPQGRLRERADLAAAPTLDPGRRLESDPPPPLPPLPPAWHAARLEARLQDLDSRVAHAETGPGTVSGRELARLRARRREVRDELYALQAGLYGEPLADPAVREGLLTVGLTWRGERAHIAPLGSAEEPELVFDAPSARLEAVGPWEDAAPFYAHALLRGALRLLFEHAGVPRVSTPAGRVLDRDAWAAHEGLLRFGQRSRPAPSTA